MDWELLHERKNWIERIFQRSFTLIERDPDDQDKSFIILGRNGFKNVGILLDHMISPREQELLQRIAKEWEKQDRKLLPGQSREQILSAWILESLKSQVPIPEVLKKTMNWSIERFPLLISYTKENAPDAWDQHIMETLDSYLPEECLYLSLNTHLLLCLIPSRILGDDANPSSLEEWVSGLYDLCQTELAFPVHLIYHASFTSSDLLIDRIKDMLKAIDILKWHLPLNKAIAPWHLIPEQMIQSIPDEMRKSIIGLYQQLGNFALFEQMEMVQTLQVFFRANLNISLAAKELYIHRNTLNYRLDRIMEETGLDPRSFQDALYLQLALLLFHREQI